MALNVTKSTELIEVKTLCFTIYSQPGLGKTSLAFTSKNPLLFDFDKGAHRSSNRKDVVQVNDWGDVANVNEADISAYDTIIIDTVGKALDSLSADIIRSNSRFAYGGALNQQGWGQLGVRFSAYLKRLRSFGKDVVLISHMDEKHDGDLIKERLKIQGGSKDLILTDSDVIARISVYNKLRHLVFSPTETSFGKDPANFVSMQLPDSSDPTYHECLSNIFKQIKDKMNAMTEGQIEALSERQWFIDNLPKVMDADGINDILGRSKKAGTDCQRLLVKRAREIGLEFDADAMKYVYLDEYKYEPNFDESEAS
jgi:hypothetical protein